MAMPGSRDDMTKELTPKDFVVTPGGELVINDAEIVKAIRDRAAPTAPTAAAGEVEVVVSVGVKF